MSKSQMTYFDEEDVLHLVISDEPEANSVELSPNITVEPQRGATRIVVPASVLRLLGS